MTAEPVSTRSDLAPLLLPIDPARPSGESLRFTPVFHEISELRREEDPTLPMGVWVHELKRSDWSKVAARCTDALTTQTKDLQFAAWLAEAWIHTDGFVGLERGIRLITALCRDFWDSLYPAIEKDDLETRLSPLVWASNKFLLPVKRIAITHPADESSLPYSWSDWEAGQYVERISKTNAEEAASAEARGMVPESKFLMSASLTPASWFGALLEQIAAALTAVCELQADLDARVGEKIAPNFAPLRDALSAIHALIARIHADRVVTEPASPAAARATFHETEAVMNESTDAAMTLPAVIPVHNRAEAYERLREASDYLLRTEPHSPVPYLVRRAISWGNMTLAEVLEELLSKNADLATIYALLGIKTEPRKEKAR